MYISLKRWTQAEAVATAMPAGTQRDASAKLIKEGRARALVDENRFKEAETLYTEMG